ncbi:MAG: histidine kinase [Hyphomonadaceae bacterium]|nr:histidine kinase [Hyphomonadaceae bacterium]
MIGSAAYELETDAKRRAAHLRAFFIFQVVFWGANFAVRTIAAIEHRPEYALAYMPNRITIVAASFVATTLLHLVLVRVEHWSQAARLSLGLALSVALVIPMNTLETTLARNSGINVDNVSFTDYVLQFGWVYFMWAGYYFAQDLLFRTRRHAESLARAQAQAHAAQLKMLRYQLNPHFLFNSLNAISALVLEQRNKEAEAMIMSLSRFLRCAADPGPSPLGRLGDEAAIQRLYLEVEAIRFGEKLRVECDVPESLHDCLVPTFLLQPIIENAIKHGIAQMPEGGWIRIAARRRDQRLVLSVENDGPILPDRWRRDRGIGLRNTEERLQAIYGDEGRCVLTPRANGGARVEITMPLQLSARQSQLERA